MALLHWSGAGPVGHTTRRTHDPPDRHATDGRRGTRWHRASRPSAIQSVRQGRTGEHPAQRTAKGARRPSPHAQCSSANPESFVTRSERF